MSKEASVKGVFESGTTFTACETGDRLVETAMKGISESFKKS